MFVCFGMQHLISLTRDRTHSPCIGSVECQPLDHKASPRVWILVNRDVPMLVFFLALTNVPQWCEMWELCVLSLQFFCKLKIKPEIKNLFKKTLIHGYCRWSVLVRSSEGFVHFCWCLSVCLSVLSLLWLSIIIWR